MDMRLRRGLGGVTSSAILLSIAIASLVAGGASAAPSSVAAWTRDGSTGAEGLGAAVSTAGDFNCDGVADLLIGAPLADVMPDGTPSWTNAGWVGVWYGGATLPPQPLDPPDWWVYGGDPFVNQTDYNMGKAVAAGDVNGDGCDDVIAAAPGDPLASEVVNVYFGSPSGPSTTFDWRRFEGSYGPYFGASVASGDVNGDGIADIIVGAPWATLGEANEGAVLVWLGSQFLASNPDGQNDPDWIAQSNQGNAQLGASVASAGDVDGDGDDEILAGAPGWDGNFGGPVLDEGIAFMWSGSPVLASAADGTPANAAWKIEIAVAGARLGAAVAGAGDLDGDGYADMLVGAPDYDNPFVTGTQEGTVLVRRGASTGLPADVYSWFHPGQTSQGRLGASLSTAGDVNGDGLADYLMGEPGTRHAYLLLGRTTSWGPNPLADVTYTETTTSFGTAVGTAGDWNGDGFSDVVVGAPTGAGKAFVYLGRGETLASAPVYTLTLGQTEATLGLGLAFAGDINHDGFSDFVSGAPSWESDASQDGEGRFFVTYGGPCGPACAPFVDLIVAGERESNQAGAQLGRSVSGAGDVNGDGYADVVAGAPLYDWPTACPPPLYICPIADAGIVRVYLGSAGGLGFNHVSTLTGGTQTGAQFGFSVHDAGDVNGDGYGDVIVGAPYGSAGLANEGVAYLYLGSASGLSTTPSWSMNGGQADAHFGIGVAGAGDVDRDGYGDVVIGADGYGGTGAAFLFLGRPTSSFAPQGLQSTPIRTWLGPAAGSSFGFVVATAGDVNRDGYSDVAVGAPNAPYNLFANRGEVRVFHGGSPPSAVADEILQGEAPLFDSNRFGAAVAAAGDVNGDGYGDLLVGDHWLTGPAGFAQGKAYVYHGGPGGLVSPAARTFEDCPTSFCDFGQNMAGAGDVNGDGFSDVVISAFKYTDTSLYEGAVFLHMGNEDRGTAVRPLQSLGFGGSPLALLGITPNWFEASMDLHSPAGRSRVRLELEVKPLGQPFDGLSTTQGVLEDNGFAPRQALDFLGTPGSVYHWRARLRSASPLFGRSRWVSLPGNAPREADVRVVPEPELLIGLAAGIGGLMALKRRRDRRSVPRRRTSTA